ncbi:MAG: hypothetical protein HC831_09985 [Chloroflexia bacterium]|nr:hypothetical protein [Chloroflexia bacterium]
MRKIFIESSNIISSLGFTTEENFQNVLKEQTGIKPTLRPDLSEIEVPLSLIDDGILARKLKEIENPDSFTRFEQLVILSLKNCLSFRKLM